MTVERLVRCGSPFDRRLVQAGRSESPLDGAEDRAIRALGASTPSSGSSAAGFRNFGLAATMGKVAVAAVLMTLGAASVHVLGARRESPVPRTSSAAGPQPNPVTARATDPPRSPSAPIEPPSPPDPAKAIAQPNPPNVRSQRRPTAGSSASGFAPSAPPRSREAQSALTLEAALVERAAQALSSGDADAALRALDEYGTRCQGRILGREADLLRVRALAAAGRTVP